MSEEMTENQMEQEAVTVNAEMLLAQIVSAIGEEFVIIPTRGWMMIVNALREYQAGDKEENLLDILEALQVPVIPVSLAPKEEEEKRILTPEDIRGESRIIMP